MAESVMPRAEARPSKAEAQVESFRQQVLKTKHPGAWEQTWKTTLNAGRDKYGRKFEADDFIRILIDLKAKEKGIVFTDDKLDGLADDYNQRSIDARINPRELDQLNHDTLIPFFLQQEGILEAPSITKVVANATAIGRRTVLGAIGKGLVAAQFAAPISAAGVIAAEATKGQMELPKSPDTSINRFNDLIRPLIETAFKKRAERAARDPEYSKRVDSELNSTKVNFLLFGYSEEDDETYADQGGSIGFMSYDLKTGVVSSVGITRETFVPKMRGMHYTIRGQDYGNRVPIIRYFYKTGGFDLMREVAEEATGLAVDYQMVMKDKVLYDLINEFVGQVEVDVVKEADTIPFKFNQHEYDNESGGIHIEKGRQKMNAIEFMRYILAGDKVNVAGKENQRPGRKNAAIKALKEAVLGKLGQEGVVGLIQLANFVKQEFARGDLKVDFDMGIMKDVIGILGRFSMHKLTRQREAHLPESGKGDLLLNDEFFGDGGMMRVHRLKDNSNEYLAAPKSIQKMVDDMREAQNKMIEQGINYDDHDKGLEAVGVMPVWMQVPLFCVPYTVDFRDYWRATRELVKARLSSGQTP